MNRPTFFVLIALNSLFIAVLAAEWITETNTSTTVVSQVNSDNSESEEALSELDLSATNEENYSDLVDRPLFIKGRKPVNEPEPENVPVAAVKKVESFVWELTGVFVTPKGMTAFFSRTNTKVPKDNYRKYKMGDDLDGWKVSEIQHDNVVLIQANETKILPLRKNKPKIPIPTQMTNRVPPPVPPQMQMQQQGIQQNLQTPDVIQNNTGTNPDDQSIETVQE
jgi:hypothetical protein